MVFVLVTIIVTWIRRSSEAEALWNSLPTVDEYLTRNPTCKTDRGYRCVHCRSNSIKNWGQFGPGSGRRIFICNHCGKNLYRSEQ